MYNLCVKILVIEIVEGYSLVEYIFGIRHLYLDHEHLNLY
jgi:hypothetical protein